MGVGEQFNIVYPCLTINTNKIILINEAIFILPVIDNNLY